MKKLFLFVFVSLVVGAATAEVIDSVSFNPSRLGSYEHLKVSDKLDVGCELKAQSISVQTQRETTLNYHGNNANLDIGSGEVYKMDMGNTTVIAPSVYIMGGSLDVADVTTNNVTLTSTATVSIHTGNSYLPNHNVHVAGNADYLWLGNQYLPGDRNVYFSLGGNKITPPTGCKKLAWYERHDEETNQDYQVLGCEPSKPKTAVCKSIVSDFGTYPNSGKDTCDGLTNTWYSGACTEAMLAKGSCLDYYNIGCSTVNITGKWCYRNSAGNYECQDPSNWRLPSYKKSNYVPAGCSGAQNCTTTPEENNCANNTQCNTILNMARGNGSYSPTAVCKALFPITDQLISSPSSITGLYRWSQKGENWYYFEGEGAYCSDPNPNNYQNKCNTCGSSGYYQCTPFKLRCEVEAIADTTALRRTWTFKTVYE